MTLQQRSKGRVLLNYWYKESTAAERESGKVWYNEAREYVKVLSLRFDTPPIICAGVVSALSPNNKWERNKIDAHAVLDAVSKGIPSDQVKVCTYNNNKRKAFAIARGDVKILKQSPKTYAFAKNISGLDTNRVTIDKWHLRATQTRSLSPKDCKTSVTALQYKQLEMDCQKVAKKYNILPSVLQATIWVTIRNRWVGINK
jgi:hypothetical protein|tara:strand:+ start:1017 stop:1619 length:603 start_codon:yes stop_codon:yes gene_type:complete